MSHAPAPWVIPEPTFVGGPARVDADPIRRTPTPSRLPLPPRPPSARQRRRSARAARAAAVKVRLNRREVLWLERFPVTILLGAQYGLLVVLPTLEHHTAPEHLILTICGFGVAVAFVIEAALVPTHPGSARQSSLTVRAAAIVFALGAIAEVISGLLGAGSYAVQLGTASSSRLVSAFTPFTSWMLFGLLMMLWLYHEGRMSRRAASWTIGAAFALESLVAYHSAFFDPLIGLALPLVLAMLLTRLIRARWLLVAVVIVVVVAPPLITLRNDRRVTLGASAGDARTTSLDERLRYDELMGQIRLMPPKPFNFDQPTVGQLVRFGLLPRLLDRGRPNLNTAERLSTVLGETAHNSASLTPLGEAYGFNGWEGIIVLVGPATVLTAWAVRRRSLGGLLVYAIVGQEALSIFGTYPDQLAQVLQSLESLAIALVLCAALSRLPRSTSP
jgi:hypothetical protein